MNKPVFNVDEKKLEVTMICELDAPRDKVWQAHVDPDKVMKWWGPRGFQMKIETFEPRVGGAWRILHIDHDGTEHWFHGIYKVVDEPEKIERTFVYEPIPDSELRETTNFERISDSKTKVTSVSRYATLSDLQGMVRSGMEWGATQSCERLAELLKA